MTPFDYLAFPFFRHALVAVVLISICSAVIGTYVITRRLVAISGGITHACFGGLGLGYYLGLSPLAMAGVFAVGAGLGVEWLSARFRLRQDSAIAVIWSVGMALGVLFVFLTPGYVPELNSFLFGNILTITSADLTAFAAFAIILGAFFIMRFRTIVICAFDPDFAAVAGLPVKFISYAMSILVALCIVLTIKLVGVMLLMSMFSLPILTAEIFYHRYSSVMTASVIISLLCCISGLLLSTLADVPCSAIIVLTMAALFALCRISRALTSRKTKA